MDDEVAPDLLDCMDKARTVLLKCVAFIRIRIFWEESSHVGAVKVGQVVVLIHPCLSVILAEGFSKPLSWAIGECLAHNAFSNPLTVLFLRILADSVQRE